MAKLVVLELGKGDFNQEVDVILEIGEEQSRQSIRIKGALPPAPDIAQHYQLWQSTYRSLDVRRRIKIKPAQTTNISIKDSLKDCANSADFFKSSLLGWYKSDKFSSIREKLFQEIDKSAEVRLIIQTQNHQLRRLPWHLFFESFLDVYRHAEVALSPPEYQKVEKATLGTVRTKVRILAILGNSTGIDIAEDRKLLTNLPDAEVVFLVEPQRQQVDELLWDEKGWDILFFAGHSSSRSDGETGLIYINQTDSLTIADLKNGLKKAIERGLQLAIFNSCDGLGLANDLASLHIPQIIVMREPVPDRVAQTFLKHFLTAFSRGTSLYAAVRETRERLQALEDEFPCATWLPIICQNPTEVSMNWKKTEINWREICREMLIANRRVTTNPLTANDGMTFEIDEIYVPLGLVERKKLPKRKDEDSPQQGSKLYAPDEYEVTRKYQHEEFFEQILRNKQSDKSQGKRLGITGEPGAGKTTQLQKIGDWILAEPSDDLAIWVSLADLQELSLEEYLRQRWLKNALGVARVTPEMEDELVRVFQSGKVWLLLDGVDEMAVANPLQNIAFQIRGWITPARVVLTCRQNVWDAGKNALENFDVYRNLDFNLEQVNGFIDKWFGNNREAGKRLKVELEKSGKERIRDAVRNPLRLALLCRSWQQREGALPETKAELYRQFTEALYEWKEESFPTTSAQRQELEAALGRLGLQAISGSSSRFRLTHRQVREVLGEVDTPLFQLAMQLGWLNQVGVAAENPSEKVYAFYHPTFEEYFAALAIDDWHFFLNHVSHNPQEGNYRVFEKQWKEVILLWLGREDVRKEQKEEFIKTLWEFNDRCDLFYGYRTVILAASGIAEFKNCSLADDIVSMIAQLGLGYFNEQDQKWEEFTYEIQLSAWEALQETECVYAIKALEKLIEYRLQCDGRIGAKSLEWLGKLDPGNSFAISTLMRWLRDSKESDGKPNWEIRHAAARILGEIGFGNSEVINALQEVLCSSLKDTWPGLLAYISDLNEYPKEIVSAAVRSRAIKMKEELNFLAADSLEKISPGNSDAINALINLSYWSYTYGCDDTQDQAVSLLKQICTENITVIQALQERLLSSHSETERGAIAEILATVIPGHEEAIDTLISLLCNGQTIDDFKDVRYQAAEALTTIGATKYLINTLIKLLKTNQDIEIKLKVTKILGKIGDESTRNYAIDTLLNLLKANQDDEIHLEVASILEEVGTGNSQVISVLSEILHNSQNERFRQKVAENLGKVNPGNTDAIDVLINLMKNSTDEENRRSTMWRLKNVGSGNHKAIDALVDLLYTCQDWETSKEGIMMLERMARDTRNVKAINGLTEVLDNSEAQEALYTVADILLAIDPGNQTATNVLSRWFPSGMQSGWARTLWQTRYANQIPSKVDFTGVDETIKDKNTYDEIIWHCAQNMTYPEFYQVWHYYPTTTHPEAPDNIPATFSPSFQSLEIQIANISSQLQPTAQTYPLYIDAQALVGETDIATLAQEICTQIYLAASLDSEIPEETVNSASQLKTKIIQVKNRLQKQHLALIFHNCQPHAELVNFCRKLLPGLNNFLHIAWITDVPIEPPLRGFPPNQPNLSSVMQSWIDEIE